MDEADRLAPRVEPRQVLPLRLPRRLWAIPVLLLATPRPALDRDPTVVVRQRSAMRISAAKWCARASVSNSGATNWSGSPNREHLDRSLVLARQLQNLGKHLQDERAPQDAFTDRIATLSDYLQRLREELRERALMSGMGRLAVRDTLPSGKSLKQELRRRAETLDDETPSRDRVAAAEQSLQRLRQQAGAVPVPELESLLQNLRAGDVQAARQLLREVIEQQQASEEMQHLERARRALEYASATCSNRPRAGPATPRPAPGRRRATSTAASSAASS